MSLQATQMNIRLQDHQTVLSELPTLPSGDALIPHLVHVSPKESAVAYKLQIIPG